jgi:hypothetical protein
MKSQVNKSISFFNKTQDTYKSLDDIGIIGEQLKGNLGSSPEIQKKLASIFQQERKKAGRENSKP